MGKYSPHLQGQRGHSRKPIYNVTDPNTAPTRRGGSRARIGLFLAPIAQVHLTAFSSRQFRLPCTGGYDWPPCRTCSREAEGLSGAAGFAVFLKPDSSIAEEKRHPFCQPQDPLQRHIETAKKKNYFATSRPPLTDVKTADTIPLVHSQHHHYPHVHLQEKLLRNYYQDTLNTSINTFTTHTHDSIFTDFISFHSIPFHCYHTLPRPKYRVPCIYINTKFT